MKLNFIFCVLAVPTLSAIVTGSLGCGKYFDLMTFRGRTIAVPLDPECRVGPASDLGYIRNPYLPVTRRWRQDFIQRINQRNTKH